MKFRDPRSDLISAYIEGFTTEEDVERLETILRTDPEFRRLFLEHLNVDNGLADFANRAASSRESQHARPPISLQRHYRQWAAVAACAVTALGIAVWGLSWNTDSPIAANTRIEVIDSSPGSDYSRGQILGEPRISISQGRLGLQLDAGPTLELSAPAEIEIRNRMHVRLHSGDVTVDVGEEIEGFILDTTTARLVDLGTRFAVSVDPTGETDVVVLEGEVEVNELPGTQASSPYVNLFAGDALTISADNDVRRLAAVTMTSRVARLGRSPQSGVVTGVSDDVADPEYHRFYGLVPGGMMENAPAYTTIGRARWHPLAGEPFPAELVGADAVRTFHDDRRSMELTITLQVTGPCTVYVMVDARNPVPDWLLDEFADTGLQLRTGPWRDVGIVDDVIPAADGGLYVSYRVWKRDISAAGAVMLGPPRSLGQPGNRAMYGIAVKAT